MPSSGSACPPWPHTPFPIRLAGSLGTAGIEVIGATRSEKIELGDLAPEIYEDWADSHEEDTYEVEVYDRGTSTSSILAEGRIRDQRNGESL